MAKRPKELRRGRIVWGPFADRNGVWKDRPLIIISPTDEITSDRPIKVMAISTRLPRPIPDDHVMLPFHPTGNECTGLRKECAAVIRWLGTVMPDQITEMRGDVPPQLMLEILQRLQLLVP